MVFYESLYFYFSNKLGKEDKIEINHFVCNVHLIKIFSFIDT